MTTQEVVAANIRARLAWSRTSHTEAARAAGCSIRSFTNKLAGNYPFRPNELGRLATLLGLADPGPLYRVPPDFATTSEAESAWTRSSAGQRHLKVA